MATVVSRYGILPSDLRIKAMTLSIGQGAADRFASPDAVRFIVESEIWAEDQVSPFLGVPLKPTPPVPGLTLPTFPGTPQPAVTPAFPSADPVRADYSPEVSVTQQGMKWNYPVEFINAIIFMSMAQMLKSEYFEVEPNKSEASADAEVRAYECIDALKRSTVRVGAGRRRNPNPHIPPSIAPKGTQRIPGAGNV